MAVRPSAVKPGSVKNQPVSSTSRGGDTRQQQLRKIEGIKADYYIAMGLTFRNMYEFPVKTFFWALSGEYQFKEMP